MINLPAGAAPAAGAPPPGAAAETATAPPAGTEANLERPKETHTGNYFWLRDTDRFISHS